MHIFLVFLTDSCAFTGTCFPGRDEDWDMGLLWTGSGVLGIQVRKRSQGTGIHASILWRRLTQPPARLHGGVINHQLPLEIASPTIRSPSVLRAGF